jgi:Domain of unknown function (DUF4349)
MDRFDDDTLVAELRELRPTPRPEFTAALDERVAAGFPGGPSPSKGPKPFARLAAWWRSKTKGRLLVPAAGLSIAVLAAVVVVVAISSSGGGASSEMLTSAQSSESSSSGAIEESTGGAEEAAPEEEGGAEVEESAEESVPPEEVESEAALAPAPSVNEKLKGKAYENGPSVLAHRDVERGTSMILGTKPGEVASASNKVFEAVGAAKGYVLHSSVQSGTSGPTAATFSMLIPNRNLNGALAAFSQIGEVRQRHDATNDITAPTVSATEELRDSNASIEGLLKELGNAETEEERESVEARLREERRRHATIRASLEHLHKRASLAEVSLRIVTPRGAGATPPSKGSDGGWSVGDALHEAGHILTVAAGVLLIALAILAPIALILLLIWLLNRFRIRRLRERALG